MSHDPDWDTVPKLRDLLDQWLEVEPETIHCSDLELEAERDPTPLPADERVRRP